MSLLKDVIGYGLHADRPAASSAGRLYYETDTAQLFRDNGTTWVMLSLGGGVPARVLLASHTVPSGGESNYDFPSIADAYKHLEIIYSARGDRAAASESVYLHLNADSGANYVCLDSYFYPGGAGSDGLYTGQTAAFGGNISCASTPANHFSYNKVFIPYYSDAGRYKITQHIADVFTGTPGPNMLTIYNMSVWTNTASINQITLVPTSGNFVEGSRFDVYGLL